MGTVGRPTTPPMRTLLLAALFAAAPALAQPFVAVQAGGAEFDLSGTGSAVVVDVRAHAPLTRVLAVEGGVAFSRTPQQFGDVTYLLPGVEIQAGVPLGGVVRPYVGLGLGAFIPVGGPEDEVVEINGQTVVLGRDVDGEGALVAAVGLDAALTDRVVLRAAGRLRGTVGFDGPDFFGGTFSELTAGLGVRF